MQREAPASRMRSLFEQNDALKQTYTVVASNGECLAAGKKVHAMLSPDASAHFVVTNCEGRQVGVIRDESGRVLAEALRQNQLCAVSLTVTIIVPIVGDARVQVIPE